MTLTPHREKELSYKMSPEREALLAEIIDDTRGSRLDSVHIHNFVREEVTSALKEKHKGHLTIMKSEINQVLEGVEKLIDVPKEKTVNVMEYAIRKEILKEINKYKQ